MQIYDPTPTYIEPPGKYRPRSSFALFNLGFRPLYLCGAAFAAIAVAIWIAVLMGAPARGNYLLAANPVAWHAHEMVFGFAAAIVVGFLLTASRAWTGIQTLSGRKLAALVAVWAAARVLVWSGPAIPAAIVDTAFLPIAAFALLHTLRKAGSRRNYFLAVALFVFGLLNGIFHILALQQRTDLALHCVYAAIGIVTLFVTVIGGRVIPMFTANAIPGFVTRRFKPVELTVPAATVLALFADAAGLDHRLVFVLAVLAFAAHLARLIGWRSWRAQRPPILGVLHQAYAWIPVGFALLALSQIGLAPHTLAVHAFTFGAIGGAIIAMITRTARGHTGRPLKADRADILAYRLLMIGAVARVFGPLIAPGLYLVWIEMAGLCWIVAFVTYVAAYARPLSRPRADGKPG